MFIAGGGGGVMCHGPRHASVFRACGNISLVFRRHRSIVASFFFFFLGRGYGIARLEAAIISAARIFFGGGQGEPAAQAPITFAGGARKHAAETHGVVFIGCVCLDVTAGSVFDAQRVPLPRREVERHAAFFFPTAVVCARVR